MQVDGSEDTARPPKQGARCDMFEQSLVPTGRPGRDRTEQVFCDKRGYKFVEGSWGGMTLCRDHFGEMYPDRV